MDPNEARRRIRQGGKDPAYRRTNDYKQAIKYTNAHYKGVLRGTENLKGKRRAPTGGGGASTKSGCSLWTCLVLIALIAVPATIINLI